MADGQLAINTPAVSPGLFFKDAAGVLVKVGPVHVGTTAPNASPASGGTAGNSVGEQWLDTTGGTYVFKVWDGSAWRSESGTFVDVNGDVMTGALVMDNQQQVRFRETTANGTNYIALQAPASVASDKTITLPDQNGSVLVSGNASIVNADVNASAAIAGTKISPDFGSQTITTTGIVSAALGAAATPSITFTGDTNTGIYSPGADQLAISTGGSGRLFVDASGNVGVGATPSAWASPFVAMQIGAGGAALAGRTDSQQVSLATNWRFAGSQNLYISNGFASRYFQESGVHVWQTASSGTAGNAITFNEAMRLDTSGRLGVGTSAPQHLLDVNGTVACGTAGGVALSLANGAAIRNSAAAANTIYFDTSFGSATHGSFEFRSSNAGTSRMVIDSSGRVGVGTTGPQYPLHTETAGTGTAAGDNTAILVQSQASGRDCNIRFGDSVNSSARIGYLSNNLYFYVNANERARLTGSGQLLVGTSTARSSYYNGSASSELQLEGDGEFSVTRNANDVFGGSVILAKTRSSGNAVVSNGDVIGNVSFQGNDGSNFKEAAQIKAEVDGTPGTGDMPGRLVFSTTADGQASPTPRMTINNTGSLTINGATSVVGGTHTIRDSGSSPDTARLYNNVDSNNTTNRFLICDAGASILRAEIRSNGGLANYSANNANLSDRNAKKDISPAAATWDCIKEWEIVNYRYKDQHNDADLNLGVIAQQVAESCPEVITIFQEAKEAIDNAPAQEERLGVKEQQMYWMAIKALQEAQVRIEQLEQRLTDAGIA